MVERSPEESGAVPGDFEPSGTLQREAEVLADEPCCGEVRKRETLEVGAAGEVDRPGHLAVVQERSLERVLEVLSLEDAPGRRVQPSLFAHHVVGVGGQHILGHGLEDGVVKTSLDLISLHEVLAEVRGCFSRNSCASESVDPDPVGS